MFVFTRPHTSWLLVVGALSIALTAGCQRSDTPGPADVYWPAGGCYAIAAADGSAQLVADATAFAFRRSAAGTPLRLRPADLGHYLLYDDQRHYWIASSTPSEGTSWELMRTTDTELLRIPVLQTHSDATWVLERDGKHLLLRHANAGLYLNREGLGARGAAVAITLSTASGCSTYPELPLDAEGAVAKTIWDDGMIFGAADAHSHLFTNLAFGGGGVFHGAPFHELGVPFALEDCSRVHGEDGKRDVVGFFLGEGSELTPEDAISVLAEGAVLGFNHDTSGYPEFRYWPNAWDSPTHQVQYYRWIERAWMAGLRLIVQHATGNSALCEGVVGLGSQTAPFGCNDMDTVDRIIEDTHRLERYIDALHGGPGKGWFRIVDTPEQAREVIRQGKLAVILGIEISNVFDCFLNPPPGMPVCTPEHVREQVETYYEKGVRIVFPVHKFDNGFAPGDGQHGVLELGNVLNSGYFNDYTEDCPDFSHTFDKGTLSFPGLERDRDEYVSRPTFDMAQLSEELILTTLPLVPYLLEDGEPREVCKAHGLTDLGRVLLEEMMKRGMVPDVAHLPRHAVVDALTILAEKKYPVLSTHGNTMGGRVFETGGIRNAGFGGCGATDTTGQMVAVYRERLEEAQAQVDVPGLPLSFDFNGIAGSRRPRFGPDSHCSQPQTNPVEWPFTSYAGDVTFTQPTLGNRTVDFNTEGMLHLGLFPELIEDVRRDGATDEELAPLFRSAEAVIRLWERAEARAVELQ